MFRNFGLGVVAHCACADAVVVEKVPSHSGILAEHQINAPERFYGPEGHVPQVPDRRRYDV